jgi:hypothetical protein
MFSLYDTQCQGGGGRGERQKGEGRRTGAPPAPACAKVLYTDMILNDSDPSLAAHQLNYAPQLTYEIRSQQE